MKIIYFFIQSFLIVNFAFSQQPFNITYTIPGSSSAPLTIIPTDTGYIVSAFAPPTIYLIDINGNLSWNKQWLFSFTTGIGQLKKDNNDNFIASGNMQNGNAEERNLIFKYNNNFDTLFTKVLNTDTIINATSLFSNCFVTNDNEYVFIGRDSKDSLGNVFNGNLSNGLFIKTDDNGNKINHKLFGFENNPDWFNTGLQLGNYYYLFGATRSYAPAYVTGFDRTDGWVVKTDLQGNEIASAAFGNPELYDGEFKFAFEYKNNIITGGFLATFLNSYNFAMGKAWILIINPDLSVYKNIYFQESTVNGDTLFSAGIKQIIINSDSTLTYIGNRTAYNMNLYQLVWKKTVVTKIDKNFKVRYSRIYTHQGGVFNNINPQTITPTSDGGYIFGGYVVDNTLTPSQQAWLVKTDSLGCDGFTSCNDTTMVVEILSYPDTLCRNDTNLIHVRIKGRSAPYSLFANGTPAMDSIYYPYTLPLWIDTLMPFIPQDTGWQQLVVTLHEPWELRAYDTVQVYVKNCTTLTANHDYYKNMVEIFPNPVTTVLSVRVSFEGQELYTVTIYNMQGKVVHTATSVSNETVVDISALPEGVYTVKVVGNSFSAKKKFVKMSKPINSN